MKIAKYKLIFITAGLIGVLLIASPVISELIRLPNGEQFSQLYLLGPDHSASNYPYNIHAGQNYSVYVGVANNMGSLVYYLIYSKFGNGTDSSPNPTMGTPSLLNPLYEYRFALPSGKTWENLLTFSVDHASISGNRSLVSTISINSLSFDVNKPSIRNTNSTVFYYQLFFELWTYNTQSNQLSFNNRTVSLNLNITSTYK